MSPQESLLHAALVRVMQDLKVDPVTDIKALAFHIGRIAAEQESIPGQGLEVIEHDLVEMATLAYNITKGSPNVQPH